MSLDIDLFEEKFRPRDVDDVIGNDTIRHELKAQVVNVVEKIKRIRELYKELNECRNKDVKNKKLIDKIKEEIVKCKKIRIRHQIFAGPSGIGKTTTAIAMGFEIYGEDFYDHFFMYNTADERKIDFMREEINNMTNRQPGIYPFNIILMDEADAIKDDSQEILKRTIENSQFAVFILVCNHINKIDDALKSRCTVRNFKKIKKDIAIKRLEEICEEESIKYDENFLGELYLSKTGDMRNCIGRLGELKALNITLTPDHIEEIEIDKEEIDKFLKLVITGNSLSAFRFYQEININYSISQLDFVRAVAMRILKTKWDPNFKSELFLFCKMYISGKDSDDLDILALIGEIYLSYKKHNE